MVMGQATQLMEQVISMKMDMLIYLSVRQELQCPVATQLV